MKTAVVLRFIIRVAIMASVAGALLFYLPFTPDPLFAKQVFILATTAVAFLAWLVRALLIKEIFYKYGVVNITGALFLLALFAASLVSTSRGVSFFSTAASSMQFFNFLALFALAFLAAAEFSREHIRPVALMLLASGGLLALHTLLRLFFFDSLPVVFQINPVGTLNANAAVLILVFLFSLAFLIFSPEKPGRILIRGGAGATALLSGASIFLINFRNGWLALASFAVLAIAFISSRHQGEQEEAKGPPPLRLYAVFFVMLAVSLLFSLSALEPGRWIPALRTEVEVSPSLQTTLAIAGKTLQERPILGSGPASFLYDYVRFRPAAINQTVFWNTRFASGFSLVTTTLAEIGVVGSLALIFFIASILYTLWRIPLRGGLVGPFEFAFGGIALAGLILWFLYTASFALSVLIFAAFGIFFALLPSSNTGHRFWQKIGKRTISIEHPAVSFASSLIVLTAIIGVLLGLFVIGTRYAAEVYAARAIYEFTVNGNSDTAIARYDSAIRLYPASDEYHRNQSQIYMVRAEQALQRTSVGETSAEGDFQTNLNAAIAAGQRASLLNPAEPQNWLGLGTIYETALPFVEGTAQFAIEAYREAAARDPVSPLGFTLLGRTYLKYIDLLDLRIQQGAVSRSEAESEKHAALLEAEHALQRAGELKSDYATAQFLLAQAYTREGNIDEAIKNGSNAALAAPEDIGVAFFLGFLYYQKNRLDDASAQFLRAVELNPNYSNARYFLGVIYDRQGRKADAITEFEKILALNPGNNEVENILKNLHTGKSALSAIAPPENRTEPPIEDRTR